MDLRGPPRLPDDGKRYEIVDGEVYLTPAPNVRHQDIVGLLFRRIGDHVERHGGGRVEVYRLDGQTYPTPTLVESGTELTTGLPPGFSIDVATLLAAGS